MIGKLRLLFWLGIIMLFLPFLGIPNTWKTILAVVVGIMLIALSISMRKTHRSIRSIIRNLEHTIAEHTIHE